MAFQESARSLHARLHVGAKAPLVVGVTLAAALVLAAAGFMLAGPGKGGFSVERADASEPQAGRRCGCCGGRGGGCRPRRVCRTGRRRRGGAARPCRRRGGVSRSIRGGHAGSRVEDAVEAAGGLAEGAAPDALNLARPLADGEQVIVPTLEEVEQSAAAGSALGAASGAGGASPASGKVNLNTAGADEPGRVAGHRPGDGGEDRGGPAEQRAFRRRRRPQAGVGHRRQEVRAAGRPRLRRLARMGRARPVGARRARRRRPASAPDGPVRPSLPPLLACALGLWAAAAASYALGEGMEKGPCLLVAAFGGVLAAVAAAALWRGRHVLARSAFLGVALGLACGGAGAAALHDATAQAEEASALVWRFEALEDGQAGAYGAQCRARATAADGRSFVVRVSFPEGVEPPRYGDAFEARSRLSRPEGTTASYCWQQGDRRCRARRRRGASRARRPCRPAARRARPCRRGPFGGRGRRGGASAGARVRMAGIARRFGAVRRLQGDGACPSGGRLGSASGHRERVRGPRACAPCVRPMRWRSCCRRRSCWPIWCSLPLPSRPCARRAWRWRACRPCFARRRPAPLNALSLCVVGARRRVSRARRSRSSFALSAGSTLGIVLLAGLFGSWMEALPVRLPRFLRDALRAHVRLGRGDGAGFRRALRAASRWCPRGRTPWPRRCSRSSAPGASSPRSRRLPCLPPPRRPSAWQGRPHACWPPSCMRLPGCRSRACPSALPVVPAARRRRPSWPSALLWRLWPRPRRAHGRAGRGGPRRRPPCCEPVLVAAPRLAGHEIVMLDVGQGDAFLVRSEGAAVLVDTGNQRPAAARGPRAPRRARASTPWW